MPPINIIVRDHRSFGRKPIIGTHVITNVLIDDPPRKCDATVDTTTVDLPGTRVSNYSLSYFLSLSSLPKSEFDENLQLGRPCQKKKPSRAGTDQQKDVS